jgi:hypothetical protein
VTPCILSFSTVLYMATFARASVQSLEVEMVMMMMTST